MVGVRQNRKLSVLEVIKAALSIGWDKGNSERKVI